MSDRRMPEPRMRDEFRRELRARLMREAYAVLAPKQRESAWRMWLRPAVALSLATIVLMAGAGGAAAGSLPGDATFGLKRAAEEVRVALTFDEIERVRLLAAITDQRLAELTQVADRSDKAPTASEEYARAVTRFREAVNALQQSAPQDRRDRADDVADAAREKHEVVLEELKDRLHEKAKASVERALEEERKDTKNEKDKKGRDRDRDKDDDDDRVKQQGATATPRPTLRTATPRPSERRETPRPNSGKPVETPEPD